MSSTLSTLHDGDRRIPLRRPLRGAWPERIGLHQLYPLLAHVVIFGGGYARQAAQAADGALAL
ncbi:hypothetical protein MHOL44478_16310 [Mycobacterium holsaticum DSM 44478]|nr:hypothetical protein [Mycolicibacterium holsaticum DSM 44478 = JCM 12374]